MVRASELCELGDPELEGRLEETRRELFNLRFRLATGQLDSSSRLHEVRRDIARILTVLRQREIAEAEDKWEQGSPGPAPVAEEAVEDEETPGGQERHGGTTPDE
jgi:large subunit ribosomal protein L29